MARAKFASLATLIALMALGSTGCVTTVGPNLGFMAFPIPISPYFQDKKEDEWWNHERYEKAPILGPLVDGGPDIGLDEPTDDEVMRALERARPIEGGLPLLHEVSWNNVRIVKEKIADYIDPPRVIPIAGPVQLHHVHYKVTVFFTETVRVGWPVPHTLVDEDCREVLYIDHNHYHMVGNLDTGAGADF
jgi:hypothetical protein